ncbi:Uncharacterised protein [uncultured archaeon]|nr:Uncharacterised protein [uncultured archaeon]
MTLISRIFTDSEDKIRLIHKNTVFKPSYQWYLNGLDGLEHKALPEIRTVEGML